MWCLLKGQITHSGHGHGSSISSVAMSFDRRTIFSASTDGAIFCWDCTNNDIHSHRSSKSGSSNRSIVSKAELASIYNDKPNSNRSIVSKADVLTMNSNIDKMASCTINDKDFNSIHSNHAETANNHNTVSKVDLTSARSEKSKHSNNHSIVSNVDLASARSSNDNAISNKKLDTAKSSPHSKTQRITKNYCD